MKNAVALPSHRISDTSLRAIQSLYDNSLYLQAYALAQELAPLQSWQGTSPRILAGRLAFCLGGARLGTAQHLMAWRQDRSNLEAFYFYIYALWSRRGPYEAWKQLQEPRDFEHASLEIQTHHLGLQASIHAEFRDFDRALDQIKQALNQSDLDPWLKVVQSRIFEKADRYPEALTAAQQALALHPNHRPAIRQTTHLLRLQNLDDEAIAILEPAVYSLESADIVETYAELQLELGHAAIAQAAYSKCLELSPLADTGYQAYWIAKIADAAYKAGNIADAKDWIHKLSADYEQYTFVRSIKALDESGQRVLLPVDFVRQHHMTCAPATLTTLMRYWGSEHSQIEIADHICYGGTASHHSRAWLEKQGWIAKEFTVTWENTQSLIDRGIPFAISTVEPNSAHMQAIIGYDSCVNWILIRDPFERDLGESWAETFFEKYAAAGPTGLLLLPPDHALLIDDLTLDDVELYTQLYHLRQALDTHQREQAVSICEQMQREAQGHRLAIAAFMAIAYYDQDQSRLLQYVNQMLKLFPDSPVWLLKKSYYLEELESRDIHLDFLREVSLRGETHPIFWQQYAQLLSQDQRQIGEAMTWLKKATFCLPSDAQNYALLAQLSTIQGDVSTALELHRFAACLDSISDSYSGEYFRAAQRLNQTDPVVQYLEQKWQRHYKKHSQPVYALAWAYQQLNRPTEMFEVLETTQMHHESNDTLRLYRARRYAEYGKFSTAHSLIHQAETNTSQTTWWMTQAEISQAQSHKSEALGLWQQVFQANPMDTHAAQAIATLLSETQGQDVAQAFLKSASEAFPYCLSLFYLWYRAVERGEANKAIAALRQWLKLNPASAFAQRELAWKLAEQGQTTEAIQSLDIAKALAPHSPDLHKTQSVIDLAQNNIEAAKESLRKALGININSQWAIAKLLSHCHSGVCQHEALAFIEGEMSRQVISDVAIGAYYDAAQSILSDQELLNALQRAFQARPDLWKTRVVLIQHLLKMQSLPEALDLATTATQDFPLQPDIWLVLAQVYEAQGDSQAELKAYEQAVQLSPGSSEAIRALAEAYDRVGEYAKSKQLLEDAIAHAPLDSSNYVYFAHNRWQAKEPDIALESLQHAIRLSPNYEWAWDALEQWSQVQAKTDQLIVFIRELIQTQTDEPQYWYRLAKNLSTPQDFEEQIDALDRALVLKPHYLDAVMRKVALLKSNQDYDAALDLCQDSCWGETTPVELRGLAISIEASRGNDDKAISQMTSLLETESDFYWGWKELARWYRQKSAWTNYLLTGQSLTQHFPQDSFSWALVGDAQEKLEQTEEAKTCYQKAFTLDPSYTSVGCSLFDLQLADGELEAATHTLTQIKEQEADEYYFAREIQLVCAQSQHSEALNLLENLCLYPSENDWSISASVEAILEKPLEKDILRILKQALSNPHANPDVGRCWVMYCLQHWMLQKTIKAMGRLPMQTPAEIRAHEYFLRLLIDQEQRSGLETYRKFAKAKLHANHETWGVLGYYDAYEGMHHKVLKWYRGWEKREGLQSWMLLPLVSTYISKAKYQEALKVSQTTLTWDDSPHPYHQVYIAYCLAYMGETTAAVAKINTIDLESLSANYQFFYYLTQALCKIQSEQESQATQSQDVIALVKQAEAAYPAYLKEDVSRTCYRLVAWKASKHIKTIKALLWAFIRGCRVNLEAGSKVTSEGIVMGMILLGIALNIPLMETTVNDQSCQNGDRQCQVR